MSPIPKRGPQPLWLSASLALLTAALVGATAALLIQALGFDLEQDWGGGSLHALSIQGTYSEEGGPWSPLTRETALDYRNLRDITVRGRLTREIPQGERLFLNVCQLWVSLRVNGREIFSLAPRAGDDNPMQAMGNQWVTVISPGITTQDEVELRFGNLYRNAYFIQFDNLLWHMYTGSERALTAQAVQKDAGLLLMGGIFLALTVFLFIAALLVGRLRLPGALQFVWLGLCTLSSALWFATLAPALSLFLPFPVLLNTLYAFSVQGIALSVLLFVRAGLTGWRRQAVSASLGVLMACLLAGICLQMTSSRDLFSLIDYFSLLDTALALLLVFCLIYEARVLKNPALNTVLLATLPLVALGVAEMLNGIVQWLEAGICFGLGLFLFALLEAIFVLRRIRRSMALEKRALELESALVQSRISIMLSQIQPHFLYNALTGIKQLCDSDPPKASAALEHFSYYLRGNLDALSAGSLIPFSQERAHVEDYLYLENMRFGDRPLVQWDLACQDFFLPPLTMQPLAENAVRHGLIPKGGVGTLTIRSRRTEDAVWLTIADDGVGFDPARPPEDGRSHVGLENVRLRLEALCGGSLQVRSQVGRGTEVTVILPQKGDLTP